MSTIQLTRQLVVFSLGAEEYALPITQVQEIIRFSEPRPVSSEASWIKGVISLRGKIIPVCDLASRLGLPAGEARDRKIVIIETGNGAAGVIVDDVQEVLTVDEQQVDEVPSAGADFIEAIAKVDTRLVVMLNPDGIFAGVEIAG
jgi:purine-binding chemotaxis protein CheW